ncbi:DUF4232 domain-containing protein [Cellulosimicrobium protaetiae]|uniref:DUF4232 domain-containing protein n=1 Tax=Cellulosimicrobium protaetiae TaxID=2587808 RepID=A0A6M5UCA2_9MICO|nr:DUF4232 domain-containing protein [Cellulosimicrobium protaetiae]QJW35724.1 DUF4232 domain-containing protein [Cellulosimicrobium protaetiae]
MDDERTVPTADGTDGPRPASARRVPRSTVAVVASVAGVGLAVVAALLAPTILDSAVADPSGIRSSPPDRSTATPPEPGDPEHGTEDMVALLLALPGVEDVQTNGRVGTSAEITLVTPLPSPEVAQHTATDASAILAAVPGGGAWSLRVEGTGVGGGTLAVEHGPGAAAARGVDPVTGEPRPDLLGADAVADAVRLVAHDPVRRVFLSPGSASVDVRSAGDLVEVAALVRAEGRGLTSLGVDGSGVGTYDGDGLTVPDDALLTLLADVAAEPGVTQVVHDAVRDTFPQDPLLTVVTSGEAAVVARVLDAATYPGPVLAYQVHGSTDGGASATRSGFVAGVAPTAGARPAGACAPGDLALGAAGFDAAAGRRFLTVTARNDGTAECVLAGAPAVRFVADDGAETDVLLEPDDDGLAPLTLAPGATAWAALSWRGGSTADDPPLVTTLLVAPHPGDLESVVGLAGIPGVGDGLDLLGGGTATIGSWAPSRELAS